MRVRSASRSAAAALKVKATNFLSCMLLVRCSLIQHISSIAYLLKMALHVPKAPGFAQMFKDGAKHYSGLEEAVFRNIQACKELAQTTRTAYGPNGMNKMVINHLEKLFVTNDAATILRELEVQQPAARMIVMASHMQEQEEAQTLCWCLLELCWSLQRSC